MNPDQFPELSTSRLRLRRLHPNDWQMVFFLRSDPEVNRHINRKLVSSKEEALAFVEKIDRAFAEKSSYYWVISEKGKGKMMGGICLWNFSEDRTKAEVGYDLSPACHGMGIMSEAMRAVLDFGKNTLDLRLIEAFTHWDNAPSRKLLERHGFSLVEGKTDPDDADNIVYAHS